MKLFLATSTGVHNQPGISKLNDCLNRDIDESEIVDKLSNFVLNHTDFAKDKPYVCFDENFKLVEDFESATIVFIHDKINDVALGSLTITNDDKLVYHTFTYQKLIDKFSNGNSKCSQHSQANDSLYRQIILNLFSHE